MPNKSLHEFPAMPGASERWSFLTSIIESRDTSEQRRRMRARPRQEINYTLTATKAEASEVTSLVSKAMGYGAALPRWHRSATIVAHHDNHITLSRQLPPDVHKGSFLSIGGVIHKVYEVEAGRRGFLMELVGWPDGGYPDGTEVVPLWECALGMSQEELIKSPIVTQIKINGQKVVGSSDIISLNPPNEGAEAPVISFDGMEVLLVRPSWASDRTVSTTWARSVLDFDIGIVSYRLLAESSKRMRSFRFLLKGVSEIDFVTAFFWRQYGRQKRFIMPQWGIEPNIINLSSNRMVITISGSNYGSDATPMNSSYFMTTNPSDGSIDVCEVSDVSSDMINDATIITLKQPFTGKYLPTKSIRSCFCSIVRLASDDLDINYTGADVASIEIGTMEVLR